MVLTDGQWAVLGPLVEACRPHAKVPPSNLEFGRPESVRIALD